MISIVIPLFNKGHVVVNTLRSVFAQTFQEFEVVVVNDGSTDNGVTLIESNFHDSRLRIVNQENQGVAVARDRGVMEAKYQYIAFLDADDEWHQDYLKIMANVINQYPDAGLYSSGGLIKNPNGLYYRLANKYLNYIGKINWFEEPYVFTHTSGTIINKEIFKKTDGSPRGMLCLQDFALFIQIALISDVIYVGLPISKYIGGVPGQTTSADEEKRYKLLKYVDYLYNMTYTKWKEQGCQNNTFMSHQKYIIRHRFKGFLTTHNWRSIDYFYDNLNEDLKKEFTKFELYLYRHHNVFGGLLWINFTKILRRIHGYTVFGEKIDVEKIPLKYRNW